jgi:hypothetical protein
VVHVRENRHVHRVCRQPRIPRETQDDLNPGNPVPREAPSQPIQVLRLHVGGVDGGARPEAASDTNCVVPEAGADVGHALARLDAEQIHDALRLTVAVARLLIGVLRGHDARDRTVWSGKVRRSGLARWLAPRHVGQQEREDYQAPSHVRTTSTIRRPGSAAGSPDRRGARPACPRTGCGPGP